ncbi:citrate lyase subunit beta [Pseudoflavonifractor sp. 524-17]|uniref:HpcH/HpaI aldolase/citrate lyase family protein n=1 Tax=Pseudoflavonifractor sp. 524-17 TaxID=2304577 RepID=UPI001379400D|nr:HpcH/HpaI aldolase/citrate lyase family protein [Pseudoflavonifractor sp. 524-17]NCE65652.1 citrate lyase subunit beta [Pseudoflavonifractor sp. 524-17]
MNYFDYLSPGDRNSLFFLPPAPFDRDTERDILRDAVGGLLYLPGGNPNIAHIIRSGKIRGLTSMALCLEDAVGDAQREQAAENTLNQLALLAQAVAWGALPRERLPLLFVRVESSRMLERLAEDFAACAGVLTGVILPKVTGETLERGLSLTAAIAADSGVPFYAMPILESAALMDCPDRLALLRSLKEITDRYAGRVLNIRIGATDLCGLCGIRRGVDTTAYQVAVLSSCIADIVRVFAFQDAYTVSGPVWEFYSALARSRALQSWSEVNGLLEEVRLDLQNGILGKTCIHPTQLLPVQASYAVPFEAYHDARSILEVDRGQTGVTASARRNKMNECKPHTLWARKILRRAGIYGVYQEHTDTAGLIRAVSQGGCYE